jgi:hypothetical protein
MVFIGLNFDWKTPARWRFDVILAKKNAEKAGIGEKGSIFAPRFYGKEQI